MRSEISTTSMPPKAMVAQSPRGTFASTKVWCAWRRSAVTVTSASTGGPELGAILPPKRSRSRPPSPAMKHSRTAIGSHSGPSATPVTPRSIRRRRIQVESPGAPPPGLSEGSAQTTVPVADCSASMTPSGVRCGGIVEPRIAKKSCASAIARRSPWALRSSVTTSTREPISGTSAYGKQCAREIDSTPSRPSSVLMRSTKLRMGSRVVG